MMNRNALLLVLFAVLALPARADLIDEEPAKPAPGVTPPGPTAPPPVVPPPGSTPAPTPGKKPKQRPSLPEDGSEPKATPPVTPAPASSPGVLAPKGGGAAKKGTTKKDGKEPVHFESKGLRGLREKGTVELLESVVITQGTMRMEADQAKVFFDEGAKDVVKVVAEGNVKMFKVDEDSGEKIKAYGNTVVFDNKSRTTVLDGNARLWRGADLVRGKKITYEMDTGWVRADRVVGEVHPDGKSKEPPPDDPPSPAPKSAP